METGSPLMTDKESLVPVPGHGSPLIERWLADPEKAIERVNAFVSMLDRLRLAAIKATFPTDWVIHSSKDEDGTVLRQVGYMQDTGAERAGKIMGIEVSAPVIEREPNQGEFADGTFAYHMLSEAFSKITGERLDYVEGSRWSGDTFFRRSVGPDEKVDPTDVRKAAYANLHGRAVRSLSGLNGVPLDMLKAAGLDTTKCTFVGYEKGKKGGTSTGASVGTAEVTVGFGNSANKTVGELLDKDLVWYVAAYTKNIADPERAKFRERNERVLAALKAEQGKRAQAAEHQEATGTEAPEESATAGRKRGDAHTRLTDAAKTVKGNGAVVAGMLRAITQDWGGAERPALSELTEAELDKLNAMPEDVLTKLAAIVKKGGAA